VTAFDISLHHKVGTHPKCSRLSTIRTTSYSDGFKVNKGAAVSLVSATELLLGLAEGAPTELEVLRLFEVSVLLAADCCMSP